MATIDRNGNVTLTAEELRELMSGKGGARRNPAPTAIGRDYHEWRAERDRNAQKAWNRMAANSPFGGGFFRMCGSIAGALAEHHENGGFMGQRDED